MGEVILQMEGIVKRFHKVLANDGIHFELERGEVHALLGENGAGKTTLMNILYGIHEQDAGTMRVFGQTYCPASPKDAIARGIGMVHQHFMLVPPMTVLENIVLGQECKLSRMDLAKERRKVQELCDTYHFRLELDTKVADLSVGAQQRVELVKALYRGANILILDEPTAVLTPQEVEELFVILQQFTEQGKSIILISHKLWEVKRICSRVTVLRNGRFVNTVNACDVTQEDLAAMMVGRKVTFDYDKTPAKRRTIYWSSRTSAPRAINTQVPLSMSAFLFARGRSSAWPAWTATASWNFPSL
jgi:simple sugar transport system ATP-binding protein